MQRAILILVLSSLVVGYSTPANASTVPQLNTEAALIGLTFPSANPCVVYAIVVDILRFVQPDDPSQLVYEIVVRDVCTGEILQGIGGLVEPALIVKSAFVVDPGYTGADLNATVDGFDDVDQSHAPLTLSLHWSKPAGSHLPDGLAAVTGTISRGSLVIVLDNSITWNKWGSASFPWTALWLCRFAGDAGPGCLGQ